MYSLLALIVFWQAAVNCDGSPAVDLKHYVVPVFEARVRVDEYGRRILLVDEFGDLAPSYIITRERVVSPSNGPCIDVPAPCWTVREPDVGEVIGWAGMWSDSWELQPPSVIAYDGAGNDSLLCGQEARVGFVEEEGTLR